jgi:HD-like signal output (HDOD) protein
MTPAERSSLAKRTRLLHEVPPFRPVAIRLLKAVRDPSQSLSEIVSLLRTDAVLTGEVLRLSNSALFGARCEIVNILQALAFVGLDRISAMILTTAIRGLAGGRNGPFTHSCWRHSLATALICQKLSVSARLEPERCYVAGLIHDIGRLVLLKATPEYGQTPILAELKGDDLLAAERDLFEVDHAEAGRWLLSQWGCPIELQNVAAWHENPPKPGACDGPLIGLVHAGSDLADLMKMSAFLSTPGLDLAAIAGGLPPLARDKVLVGFPELAEWVATSVNDIELHLS